MTTLRYIPTRCGSNCLVKKLVVLLVLAVLQWLPLSGQTWQDGKRFSATGTNNITNNGISVRADGVSYIIGTVTGNVMFGNLNVTLPSGTARRYLAKLDSEFEPVWIQLFDRQNLFDVTTDVHGNVFVVGTQDTLVFVAKYSACGEELATFTSSNGSSSGLAVRTDAAGNCYVAGRLNATTTFGGITVLHPGNQKSYLMRLSPDLSQVAWAVRTGQSTRRDQVFSMEVSPDGYVYTGGNYNQSWSLWCWCWSGSFFVEKHHASSGAQVWRRILSGGSGTSTSLRLALSENGAAVYALGDFKNTVNFGNGISLSTSSGNDDYHLFLARLNSSDGNVLWAEKVALSGDNYTRRLAWHQDKLHFAFFFVGTALLNNSTVLTAGTGNTPYLRLSPANGQVEQVWRQTGANILGLSTSGRTAMSGNFTSNAALNLSSDLSLSGTNRSIFVAASEAIASDCQGHAACASSNSPLCAGQTLKLNANGGGTYQWTGPNGFSSDSQNPEIPQADDLASGTYTLVAINGAGCADTVQINVEITPAPAMSASGNSPLCPGDSLQLMAEGGQSYAWSGPGGFVSQAQNPFIPSEEVLAGEYTVTIEAAGGCVSEYRVMVVLADETDCGIIGSTLPLTFMTHPAEGLPGDTIAVPVSVLGFQQVQAVSLTVSLVVPALGEIVGLDGGALPQNELSSFLYNPHTMTVAWASLPDGRSLADGDTAFYVLLLLQDTDGEDCSALSLNGSLTELLAVQLASGAQNVVVPEVIDTSLACRLRLADVAGRVFRRDDQPVQEVAVWLNENLVDYTDALGAYRFDALPADADYRLRPEKDTLPRNGLNIIDVVRLQQHILNDPLLDSPYDIIAADVNGDGIVNALDASILIQMILFGIDAFPGVPSWRFVPEAYVFSDPANPFAAPFPEAIDLPGLQESRLQENFIAIKTGDLDLSASTAFGDGQLELRSAHLLSLYYPDAALETGEVIELPIYAANFDQIDGWQLALQADWQKLTLEGVLPGALPGLVFNDAWLAEGWLAAAWADWQNTAHGLTLDEAAPLFYLRLRARRELPTLAGLIQLDGSMQALASEAAGTARRIELSGLPMLSSVLETAEPLRLEAFPNPFSSSFTLRAHFSQPTQGQLQLLDAAGRIAWQRAMQSPTGLWEASFDGLGDLPAGFYVLRLFSEQGQAQLKLIKE